MGGGGVGVGAPPGARRLGTTKTAARTTTIPAPITGSSHGLLAVCFGSIAAALGAGAAAAGVTLGGGDATAAGLALTVLELSLTERSAACWAEYAWTLRRTHSPGRPGSIPDKRR